MKYFCMFKSKEGKKYEIGLEPLPLPKYYVFFEYFFLKVSLREGVNKLFLKSWENSHWGDEFCPIFPTFAPLYTMAMFHLICFV